MAVVACAGANLCIESTTLNGMDNFKMIVVEALEEMKKLIYINAQWHHLTLKTLCMAHAALLFVYRQHRLYYCTICNILMQV